MRTAPRRDYCDHGGLGGNAMLLRAITIVLVGLTISFFCSLLEGCVLSLSRAEVLAMGRETRSGRIWAGFKREVQMPLATILIVNTRSEERRVGKECRSRASPYH